MGPPLQGQSESIGFGRGRRYKGISSAAWFRVLLQHAGAVHPCTARTKSPCSDVLRDRGVPRFGGHFLQPHRAGIDEATDIHLAKDAAVRGSGASRPWMACARLLEPWMAESGDAHDPRTAAAPPEADKLQCFEALLPRLPPKPVGSGAFRLERIQSGRERSLFFVDAGAAWLSRQGGAHIRPGTDKRGARPLSSPLFPHSDRA